MPEVSCSYYFPKPIWFAELEGYDLQPVIDQIYQYEKTTKSRMRSNKGRDNFQSGDIIYYPDKKDDPINDLIFEIGNAVQFIHSQDRMGYVKLSNAWFNINRKDGLNVRHNHPGSMYSGVIWLKAPKDGGNFVVSEEGSRAMIQNEAFYGRHKDPRNVQPHWSVQNYIEPKEGKICVFPSFLEHEVSVNKTDKDRISLSFNFLVIDQWTEEGNLITTDV